MMISWDQMWEWLKTPEALAGGVWFLGAMFALSILFEMLRTLVREVRAVRHRRSTRAELARMNARTAPVRPGLPEAESGGRLFKSGGVGG